MIAGCSVRPFISSPIPSMAAPQSKDTETPSSTKPVKTFRLRGISASIFPNHAQSDGRDIIFHKVSVQRSYKDGDEWKHTTSFGRDDLPVLQIVLQRAWEFILDTEAARGKDDAAA
jgi:hypothetical protein